MTQLANNSYPSYVTGLLDEAMQEAVKRLEKQAEIPPYEKFQRNPARFGHVILGHNYTEDVLTLMKSVVNNTITVARSAMGTGKSFASAAMALWFYKTFPDSQVYVTAAPPLDNLKNILWGEILEAVRKNPEHFMEEKITELRIASNSRHFITGVTIPMTGTAAERKAKFCMDADDLFEMRNGTLVPFNSLIGENIDVMSVDGYFHRKWSQAEFFDNGVRPIYELTFDDGEIIRRTGEHPLYTGWNIKPDHHIYGTKHHKGCYRVCDEGWIKVSDLRDGHVVLCPDSTDFNFGDKEIDENLVKFLGYMIGDGCTKNGKKSNRLQFTQERNAQLDEFLLILDNLDAKYNVSDKKKYNWVGVSTHDPRLSDFIRQCGLSEKGSADKFIPELVYGLSKKQIAIFLSRLFSTDGWACFTNKAEIGYSSKSRELIDGVQRLLRRFGIYAKILPKTSRWNCHGEIHSDTYWRLFISHSIDIIRFVEQIGIYGKEEAIDKCYQYSKNVQWVRAEWRFEKPGYRWKKIKSIRTIGEKPTVGISVPGNNTFLTSLVEHNSGKHSPHIFFIIDEGDAVPPEVYEGIEGCMSGGWARLLIMFNPRAQSGPVFEMENKQQANIVHLSAFRHPNVMTGKDVIPGAVSRETVVRRINEWTRPLVEGESEVDSDTYQIPDFLVGATARSLSGEITYPPLAPGARVIVEPAFPYMVLGEYPSQGENQLISREWIDAAQDRWKKYVEQHGETPPEGIAPRLGLDVGEYGTDFNVPVLRYKNYVPRIRRIWQGVDTTVTATIAGDLCRHFGIDVALVDGTGAGSGVASMMARDNRGLRAVSVKVSSKPGIWLKTEMGEFYILRDQLWWAVREWLRKPENEAMLPPEPMLVEELLCPTYKVYNGKIYVMSKDDMRARLRRSPNYADALALTFVPSERAKVKRLVEE